MNTEETKKAIEVMQAYVDGKEIQYETDSNDMAFIGPKIKWYELAGEPCWSWTKDNYRIKPVPRVFYGYMRDGKICDSERDRKLLESKMANQLGEIIKLQEVL